MIGLNITSLQMDHPPSIKRFNDDYLDTLIAPLDGMWESTLIPQSTFWGISVQGDLAGYFCVDSYRTLLRFSLFPGYQAYAAQIFRWIISTYQIEQAIASTIEPFYFSLCLDFQRRISLHSYLFRDNQPIELSFNLSNPLFKKAEESDLAALTGFYYANTDGSQEWIEPFLKTHFARGELFVLYEHQLLVAIGECRPSQKQPPYADLGMMVAQLYRNRGLGSTVLTNLKSHCYMAGLKPICSCEAANPASKKAIEKAGFVAEHRIVNVQLTLI